MDNPIQTEAKMQRRKGFGIASFILQSGVAGAFIKGLVSRRLEKSPKVKEKSEFKILQSLPLSSLDELGAEPKEMQPAQRQISTFAGTNTAGGEEDGLHLEIAHVLFIDVVGYSKLLVGEQREVVAELNQIVRKTKQFNKSETEGKLIRLPSGDGMALVFFKTLEEPIHCALEVARALKNHERIRVRMGVHSGPVDQVKDVNDRIIVAGAGINMAERVMGCGDAGHILLSKRVADDLVQEQHWQPLLHDLC